MKKFIYTVSALLLILVVSCDQSDDNHKNPVDPEDGTVTGTPTVVKNNEITGVAITPSPVLPQTSISIYSGQGMYFRAVVDGSGDYDLNVTWSVAPEAAGNVSDTGLFISRSDFVGEVILTATSVGNTDVNSTVAIDVSAGGCLLHVDTSNAGVENGTSDHPYNTIQEAIDDASTDCSIKVAQGTYIENISLPDGNNAKNLVMLGGFLGTGSDFDTRDISSYKSIITASNPNQSVLQCGGEGNAVRTTSVIDGFTIRNGTRGIYFSDGWTNDGTIYISNNIIENNSGYTEDSDYGGGINTENISTYIINNIIKNNECGRGGGIAINSQTVYIKGNSIMHNIGHSDNSHGGGVLITGAINVLLLNNIISGNSVDNGWGGGIHYANSTNVLSKYNVFFDNTSVEQGGGVYVDDESTVTMMHDLVYKNTSTNSAGGGIFVDKDPGASTLNLKLSTVAYNVGTAQYGNGIYVIDSYLNVENCIIWGNSGDFDESGGSVSVTYSNTEDTITGEGNISMNPLFVDSNNNDFHLKSTMGRWSVSSSAWITDDEDSPCIDAGNPSTSYINEPSSNGSSVNMGAYGNTYQASKSK